MKPEETKLIGCFIKGLDLPMAVEGTPTPLPMFDYSLEHGVQCRLENYAIIPMEEYRRLCNLSATLLSVAASKE